MLVYQRVEWQCGGTSPIFRPIHIYIYIETMVMNPCAMTFAVLLLRYKLHFCRPDEAACIKTWIVNRGQGSLSGARFPIAKWGLLPPRSWTGLLLFYLSVSEHHSHSGFFLIRTTIASQHILVGSILAFVFGCTWQKTSSLYPPVVKRSNWRSPINGGSSGNIIYTKWIFHCQFYYRRLIIPVDQAMSCAH